MQVILVIMRNNSKMSTVMKDAFLVVGALVRAVQMDFIRHMESFAPFLFAALKNHEDIEVCIAAIGLINDISRSLNEGILPYCDRILRLLTGNFNVIYLYLI